MLSLPLLHGLIILILVAEWPVRGTEENQLHYRHEFKHSFKGPHLMQPDHTIPFWDMLGDTVAGDEQVRLVSSIRDKKGLVWSKYPFAFDSWKIEVELRISGRGRIGADGMGIWYTTSSAELGPVYGSKDFFTGMGVFLDSFDNDNRGNNPFISVVVNDGTKHYDHGNDGLNEQNGGCMMDFRNRPFPVKIRVIYSPNELSVYHSSGNFEEDDFQHCATVTDVHLPPNGFFGVSAATGGLADDHDVLKFQTWSVHEKAEQADEGIMQEDERMKLQEGYEKNMEDFNTMQEEYKKEHPETAKTEQHPGSLFEGVASPELASIFDVQSAIKKDIRELSSNLDRVLAEQVNLQRMVSSMEDTVRNQGQHQGAPAAGADDSAKKYHIDNVLNMQRESHDSLRELRTAVTSVQSVIGDLGAKMHHLQQKASGAGGGESYEAIQHRSDMQQRISDIQADVRSMMQRQAPAPKLSCPAPEMPSCVSAGVLLVISAVQVLILIVYLSVRASREDAAKKFF